MHRMLQTMAETTLAASLPSTPQVQRQLPHQAPHQESKSDQRQPTQPHTPTHLRAPPPPSPLPPPPIQSIMQQQQQPQPQPQQILPQQSPQKYNTRSNASAMAQAVESRSPICAPASIASIESPSSYQIPSPSTSIASTSSQTAMESRKFAQTPKAQQQQQQQQQWQQVPPPPSSQQERIVTRQQQQQQQQHQQAQTTGGKVSAPLFISRDKRVTNMMREWYPFRFKLAYPKLSCMNAAEQREFLEFHFKFKSRTTVTNAEVKLYRRYLVSRSSLFVVVELNRLFLCK